MKNILLATDFSLNAHRAALLAGELSARLGGRLIIFHALPPTCFQLEGTPSPKQLSVEETAQKKLDTLAQELHERFGISVSRLLKPGVAEEEVSFIATQLNPKLLITGAQGENLCGNRLLGSLATAMLQNKEIPLVCVPLEGLNNLTQQLAMLLNSQSPLCNSIGLTVLHKISTKLMSTGLE